MAIRNDKGQFVSIDAAMVVDLEGFIEDWKRWAIQALRKGDRVDALRCKAEMDSCRQKLSMLKA
ncbi:hypothetical protein [Pseudomonas laurylsulfatiphila]